MQQRPTQLGASRCQRYGLEMPVRIRFRKWRQGDSLTKTIAIKNVRYKAIRISCHLQDVTAQDQLTSSSPFILNNAPKNQLLSPGKAVSLDISFTAHTSLPSAAALCIVVGEQLITIPISSEPEAASLKAPPTVDLGLVAVEQNAQGSFVLQNQSTFTTTWKIEAPLPFVCSPAFGVLTASDAVTVCVHASADEAKHLRGVAVIKFDGGADNQVGTITTELVARYTFPVLVLDDAHGDEKEVEFGEVPVGKTASVTAVLRNVSSIDAKYDLSHLFLGESCCTLSGHTGVVSAGKEVELHVSFAPRALGQTYHERFVIETAGSCLALNCHGTSPRPRVLAVQGTDVGFGRVQAGGHVQRVVTLSNTSTADVSFRSCVPDASFLALAPNNAVIPALSNLDVTVTFCSQAAVSFYDTLWIVFDIAPALCFTCRAACTSAAVPQPRLLTTKAVECARSRQATGLHLRSSRALRKSIVSGDLIAVHDAGLLHLHTRPQGSSAAAASEGRAEAASRSSSRIAQSRMSKDPPPLQPEQEDDESSQAANQPLVTASQVLLDFGRVAFGRKKLVAAIPPQVAELRNNAAFPVHVTLSQPSDSPFTIEPLEQTIQPGESGDVTVRVATAMGQQAFFETVSCLVVPEELLSPAPNPDDYDHNDSNDTNDVTHVEDVPEPELLVPAPETFELGLRAVTDDLELATTASDVSMEAFIPQQDILFPLTHVSQASHGTLRLLNPTAHPVAFTLEVPAESDPGGVVDGMELHVGGTGTRISISKMRGFVGPGAEAWVAVSVHQQTEGSWTANIPVEIDGYGTVIVRCHGDAAHMKISCPSSVVLPPVAVGWTSANELALQNTSMIAGSASISIEGADKDCFIVHPLCALVEPNEVQKFRVEALSTSAKSLEAMVVVRCVPEHLDEDSPYTMTYRSHLAVAVEEPKIELVQSDGTSSTSSMYAIDLGKMVVGSSTSAHAQLRNTSNAVITCELSHTGGTAAHVLPSRVMIPPHSTTSVRYTVTPTREGRENFTILCSFVDEQGVGVSTVPLLDCTFQGTRPKFSIRDVRSSSFSTANLWRRFNVAELNAALNPLPNADIAGDVHCLDFGVAPHLDEDTAVVLCFANESSCDCQWSLEFAADAQWKPEPWADTATLTEDEEMERLVLKHKLFSVFPKSGNIAPGETAAVTLKYKHDLVDEHRIGMVLKRENSKDIIRLELKGTTLPAGQAILQVENLEQTLEPVVLGSMHPSEQQIKLRNPCDVDLEFTVDTLQLELMQAKSYNFPVFSMPLCKGVVPARATLALPILFQPLRETTYVVELPITTSCQGQDSVVCISVVAQGVLPNTHALFLNNANRERGSGTDYDAPDSNSNDDDDDDDLFTGHSIVTTVPVAPAIQISEMMGHLSCDFISIGAVALHSIERRVIFIVNDHASDVMQFEWDFGCFAHVLAAIPASGEIAAGGSMACKLVFTPCDGVRHYDMDVQCLINNFSACERAARDSERVQQQRQLQAQEFTLTDKNRVGRGRAGGLRQAHKATEAAAAPQIMSAEQFSHKVLDKGFTPSLSKTGSNALTGRPDSGGPRLQPVLGKKQVKVSDMDLRTAKYQTLPPIEMRNTTAIPEGEAAPVPQRLLLNICAHVVDNDTFNVHADADKRASVFVDQSMFTQADDLSIVWETPTDRAVGVAVLEEMISEVLHANTLLEKVQAAADEPVPSYYSVKAMTQAVRQGTLPDTESKGMAQSAGNINVLESCLESMLSDALFAAFEQKT